MSNHKENLLSDPQFLAEASAGNAALDTLNDPAFMAKAVTADRRGNDFAAGNTFIYDLKHMSYYDLGKKYGREVVDNRDKWQAEVDRQRGILATDRTTGQEVGDFSLSAGSAVTSLIGGLASGILSIGGAADEAYDPTLTGLSEEAAKVALATGDVAEWITNFQSTKLRERRELGSIAAELDDAESAALLEQDLAEGRGHYIAGLARMGRDALSAGERLMEDGAAAGDILAQGLGSILGSGKVAGAGAKLFRDIAIKTGGSKAQQAIALAAGSSTGIALTESSGVYTQAIEEVMGMTEEEMMKSPGYVELREGGMDHNQAQLNIANSVAQQASIQQFPAAAAAGLLTARFNASPLKAFRGKSFMEGITEVGKQTLEEGFQGASGAFNVGVAIQAQVDKDRSFSEGVGGEFTTGAFAGFGIAGVLGAPRAARVTTVATAKGAVKGAKLAAKGVVAAARSETAASILSAAGTAGKAAGTVAKKIPVRKVGRGVMTGLDVASKGAKKVADVVRPVTAPIGRAAKKGLVDPAAKLAKRAATRPNKKAQNVIRAAANMAAGLDPDNKALARMVRVTELLDTTRVEDFTDRQVLGTAAAITALRREADSMDIEVKKLAKQMLASKDMAAIEARVLDIDLNNVHTEETKVTLQVAAETLAVAQINPGNVHPAVVAKVLKHKDINLTKEQRATLELAAKIATVLNVHRDAQEAPEAGEAVSRSFQVEGFDGLPSINQLANDVLEGSDDGTVLKGGRKIPVKLVTEQFRKLVTHMRNKVAALNKSILSGTNDPVEFESLVGGKHLVKAGAPGGSKGVVYHANSAGSEKNAKRVHTDATAAAEVYNLMVEAHPKLFPGGKIIVEDLLPGNTAPTTAAVEAVEDAASVETKAEPEAKKDVAGETTEQPKPDITTPEEDAIMRKLHDELRALKKEATILREAKDDITEQGPELEAAFDRIDAQRKLIAAKDAEISAVFEARRDVRKDIARREAKFAAETAAVDEKIAPTAAIDEEADTQPSDQKSEDGTKNQETGPGDAHSTEVFDNTFIPTGKEVGYETGNDILNLLNVGTNTTQGYRDFAKSVFTKLIDGANKRMSTVTKGSDDGRSIKEQILDGDTLTHLRDFKNTMLVDPTTGEYDPALLSIAVVAVIDWLSSVKSADPNSKVLRKRLAKMGIKLSELNSVDHNNILNGVSPQFVAEDLAKIITRMWNVKVNPKGQMVDARGAAEGLVKELLMVLTNEFDFISMHKIPINIKGNDQSFLFTFTMNVKGLKKAQKEIGLTGQNSVQKLLEPEFNTGPSIGEKIDKAPTQNRRGTADLSHKEQKAVKAEQDVPHNLAIGISQLISALGFDVYATLSGWEDPSHLAKNHPLRNSIEGKNLSIERDWDDAHAVIFELQGDNAEKAVYYRIAVTKAGRHQQSGINPQNNKTLRVMVSSQGDTLDMTNQDDVDGFWLTIAQASGLGKDFKVENVPHEIILATVQDAFNKKYGDAVKLLEDYLNTGELDHQGLVEAVIKETGDKLEMEQFNAIYHVATLNIMSRKTNALASFPVTIGFELDGKTDGPSHMLNNMGQGLLTDEDWKNFQRVGLFLGTTRMNLNKFFGQGNVDLYFTAAKNGMNKLYSEMAQSGPAVKSMLYASARFAAVFGDFRIGADGLPEMTRDTTKNPMTQTVYGAGLFGVARGISEEMVIEFYRRMISVPKGQKAADFLAYPSLAADFELLFNTALIENTDWTQSKISNKSMDAFADVVTEGIGNMIATAAKDVMGEKINKVNDLLIYITNVQTEFMVKLYNKKLLELAEKRASQKEGTEGWIGRVRLKKDPKDGSANTGRGIQRQLMVEDFKALDAEIMTYAPTYENGVQTLALGAFSLQPSNQQLSSNMEGGLSMQSNMNQPEVARVKAIPYLTQGRGDAMVVNEMFGGKNPPTDVFAVHDGFYVKIRDIKKYGKQFNEVVMKVWERDVIGDVVEDFERFVGKIDPKDVALVQVALQIVKDYPFETSVKANTINGLMIQLKEHHRQNQARKAVFEVIPKSVDHLAGSSQAATSGPDVEMDRTDVNELIADKLEETRPTEDEVAIENDPAHAAQEEEMNIFFRKLAADGMKADMDQAAKRDSTEIVLPSDRAPADKKKRKKPTGKRDAANRGEANILETTTSDILEGLGSSNRLVIKDTVKILKVLMADVDYKVFITSNRIDLAAKYDEHKGEGSFESEGLKDAIGWADIDNKTMYILSNTHETLTHEMIHLATFAAVEAHYTGEKTNDAVPRLETLMAEFMEMTFTGGRKTLDVAGRATQEAIAGYRGKTDTFSKTAALNEFMAWTLTNAALVKKLKNTQTSLVARLTKKVRILIQRLLGNKIPSNMYNHILFNTLLLSDKFDSKVKSKSVFENEQKVRNEKAVKGLIEADARNKREGRDPFTNQKISSVELPGEGRFIEKDQKKADKANKFIGRGSDKSSTKRYARAYGEDANSGKYEATDVVFISAEGQRQGRLSPDTLQIQKAIDAGVMFITDVIADRTRPYNLGERQVAEYLSTHGYTETSPGIWNLEKTDAERAAQRGSEEFSPTLIDEGDIAGPVTEASDVVTPRGDTTKREPSNQLTASEIAVQEDRDMLKEILDEDDGGDNINDNRNNGNGDGGGNGEVTPAARQMTNFWIDLIKQKLEDAKAGVDAEVVLEQFERYRNAAREALTKLDFGGFSFNDYQKRTFKAIHMVLATETRLNVNPAIAMNQVFEHITTNLKPEMFGNGRIGQERYSAVMELLGDTKNDEGVSDALAVLLALSQTSDGFRTALDQLPDPEKDTITDGSLNDFLTMVSGLLMNKAVGTIDIEGRNAKDLMDELAQNLIREDTANEYDVLRALNGSITKADKWTEGLLNTLAERASEVDRAIQGGDRSVATKILVGTVAGALNFVSSNRSSQVGVVATNLVYMGVNLDNAVFLREFVTEVVGTTKTNAEVTAILDRTSYKVSGIRQDLKEGVPVILQDAFDNHPDEVQWKATFRVLAKLDFAHLFDVANPERSFRLLTDNNLLSEKTAAAEAVINKAFDKKTAAIILEKGKQLAAHMNLKGPGFQLWKNAYQINKQAGKYNDKMTKAIDTVISLYALEIADQDQKDTVAEMFENDRDATMNLVTYMQALNIEEDLKIISEKARLNGQKGWVPNTAKKNHRMIIEDDAKGDELIRTGWVRVGDYLAEDRWSTDSWGYYRTSVRQGGNYSQGVMQSIQSTYRGVNATTGLSVDASYSGAITGVEAEAITEELARLGTVENTMEALIPHSDERGVLSYERYMDPDMMEDFTKPRENLALMLGTWAGRQVEEKMANQFNLELLIELKRIYDERGVGDDALFFDISNPKLKDPIYRDTWENVNYETRQQIKLIFGKGNGFMIQKGMVNLAMGYRDPSIMDIWTGKTRMPEFVQDVIKAAVDVIPGNQAVAVLSRTEEGLQGAVATAKDIIVVRSLIVPYMNTQANVFQLMGRGVGLKQMKEGYLSKTAELDRFNVNTKKLMKLNMDIALAGHNLNKVKILESQVQVIEDENKRMSIHPLIEAGQYKNISEGITDLDVDLLSGRMSEWIEGQVNRLPETVQTIVKHGLLSKETAIYKMANKAVQYGDFLAKSILYDHYMANGLDHETALRKINEEFVNFSILPGRMRTGLETIGATWFLSFKIRIMKVAMNQLRENPIRALIIAGTVGVYGSPGNDNLVTVAADGNRLGFALGWDQLLGAPELNPYMNMLEWSKILE